MSANNLNPQRAAAKLADYWSPKVIAELDDNFVKVAKVKGTFAWHNHATEDELFYVLDGTLIIELENDQVSLQAGDLYVVPKGVNHRPVAAQECLLLLIEKQSTLHTGAVVTEQTRSIEQQLASD